MLRSTTNKFAFRNLNVLKTSVRCNSLVIIDPVSPNLNAITAAKQLNKPIDCLVVGDDVKKAKELLKNADSIRKVYFAEDAAFKGLFPEIVAPIGKHCSKATFCIGSLSPIKLTGFLLVQSWNFQA